MRSTDGPAGRKPNRRVLFFAGYAVLGLIGILMSNAKPRVDRASITAPASHVAAASAPPAPSPQVRASPSVEALAQVRSLASDPAVPARLDQLRALVRKRAWRPARKLVDDITPTLAPLADVTPASAASDADRLVLVRAAELKDRFDEYRAALAEFEIAVFDAAYRVLWAPENAKKDEARMLASVARRFHLQGADVKEILILHDDRMTARLAQEGAAERAGLEAKCGPEPSRSGWDGSMPAVEQYLKRGAHDPGSVEVRNCAAPTLSGDKCWTTVCDVLARNAFGAKVASTMRFTIGKRRGAGLAATTISAQGL